MSVLATRVLQKRTELGLSQKELGKRAGVSQQTIDNIESGNTTRPRALPEIARVLGVSVDWLVGVTDDPTPPSHRVQVSLLALAIRQTLGRFRRLGVSPSDDEFAQAVAESYEDMSNDGGSPVK